MTRPVRFTATEAPVDRVAADLLVLPVFEGVRPGPGVAELAAALGSDPLAAFRETGATGKPGETALVSTAGTVSAPTVLLLGVGPEDAITPTVVRDASMIAARAGASFASIATTIGQLSAERSGVALAEGMLLGSYQLTEYRTGGDRPALEEVLAIVTRRTAARVTEELRRGEVSGRATNLARRLVDKPAIDVTPAAFADEARRTARRLGLEAKVWSARELEREGFGGIVGVGRASENAPRLVELSYRAGRGRPIAITGKGITFDSGGLDLKNDDEMMWMKSDMAGAAAALASIQAAAELDLGVNVDVLLPLAENMPGAAAIHPGDVIRHRGGRTSEVGDTDAEGRVLLADALAYLCERRPAAILDSATLTDGSGLGPEFSAAMGTSSDLMAEVVASGREAGEECWEIPLWDRYRPLIDSDVADVKNVGEHDFDSAMMAGLFLKDFVDGVPWVHLDTGSSAYAEHEGALWPEGGTGAPTRTFIRFLERRAQSPAKRSTNRRRAGR
ncbi:MAG: leucyl aminopeptidase [Actinomycetota bacterium]